MSSDALKWAKGFDAGSPVKKSILLILADYADSEWSCFPGKEKLAAEACTSVRTVQRVLAEWESQGLISRHYRKSPEGRGRTSDRIFIHPPDQHDSVSPWSASEPTTNVTPQVDQRDTTGRPTCQSLSPEEQENLQEPPVLRLDDIPAPKIPVSDLFAEWWAAWPKERRIDKAEALDEYRKALKETTAENLLTQNIAYGRLVRCQGTEPRFIVHPKRWLSKRRWMNDYEALIAVEEEKSRKAMADRFTGPEMRFG